MKKVLLVLLICLLTLVGCGKKEDEKKEKEEKKDPIVGVWAHDSYVYTFNEDKTCNYHALGNDMKCTYTVEDDQLSILYEGNTHPFETTFKIENKTLIIKDSFDNDVEYKKK
jgi:uncharacterized lipoprotein YehR (DUF1307 family)